MIRRVNGTSAVKFSVKAGDGAIAKASPNRASLFVLLDPNPSDLYLDRVKSG